MLKDNVIFYALLLATSANVTLGALVIMRNRASVLNRCFFALALSLSGWIVTNAIFKVATDNSFKFIIALASYTFASLLAVSFYLFSIVLVRHVYKERRLFAIALTTFGLAMGVLAIIPGAVATSVRGSQIATNSFALNLYGLSILLLLTRCVYVWVRGRMRSKGQDRVRINVILLSFSVAALIGLLCNLILPIWNIYDYVAIGPSGSLFFVAGTAFAIVRSKLFDIRFFVVVAIAYLSTLFIATFLFITPFIIALNYLLGTHLGVSEIALVVFLSVCLLYLLQFLRRFFDRFTTRLFFRNYYDPQDVLDKLGDILVRTSDLRTLREQTGLVLHEALKPSVLRFVLLNDENNADVHLAKKIHEYCTNHGLSLLDTDELEQDSAGLGKYLRGRGIALAMGLHTTHEDLGYIILGHRRSGEIYTSRDRRLLGMAADEIAISLQNALRFEQIQRFNVTLQEEVDSATSRLRRTNRRLEELDDIKDDFISMASHQLRTPLTSVKGYLSMVLEGDAGKLNPTQKQMLKQAFTSSQRMVFLITDLLNVSRLKTGKFVIDATPTDLSEVVQQELDQLHEAAEIKNIELSFVKPPKLAPLMLDETKIRQVIMNFVDNAIYYTPQGGHIRVELTEKPSTIEMRVVDDGIGVPKSEQHHLFTKFYRATNARKARPDGTGLGLFMAQKVITAQGGSIIFSSQENKGSTFGFVLSKSKLAVPANTAARPDMLLGVKLPPERRKASARLANIR